MTGVSAETDRAIAFVIVGLMIGAGAVAGGYSLGSSPVRTPPTTTPLTAPVNLTIHMKNFQYSPQSAEVQVGATVTWINEDDVYHTVTSDESGGPLQSANVMPGQQYRYTFNAKGTFDYHCVPHAAHDMSGHGPMYSGMVGRVMVVDSPSGNGSVGGHQPLGPAKLANAVEVGRSAFDVPPAITRATPETIEVFLEAKMVTGVIDTGATYDYWTFNGTVPGPMIRVMVNDTVVVHLKNTDATMTHSIDLHAVMGPGGGASVMQVPPGETKSFSFKAMRVGLFVYHCATPPVDWHIANGMYGLILVEPEGGLPPVDREYYVVQGEFYTTGLLGEPGHHLFSSANLLLEQPTYVVFNGRKASLMAPARMLHAEVNDTVRIFFGNGGPNFVSSFHVIGQIFDRVYPEGDLVGAPHYNIQTTLVPAGGAVMVEFETLYPGTYLLVDHSITRTIWQGSLGGLAVNGTADPIIYNPL